MAGLPWYLILVISRRSFLVGGLALAHCTSQPGLPSIPQRFVELRSRPGKVSEERPPTSEPQKLNLANGRDGVYYVPAGRTPPSPLILMLHGATSSGARAIAPLIPHADRTGAILLAPDSRDPTWDIVTGKFPSDVPFIDHALERLFTLHAIDPHRISVAGVSDGATYSLTLGISNGDLFSSVAAFSPGYLYVGNERKGRPSIFISHGTHDEILSFERSGKKIATMLTAAGYSVDFEPFDGGHTFPPSKLLTAAIDSLVKR